MKNRQYYEDLAFGGKLVVQPDSWMITYYFAGPDLRYSGSYLAIQDNEVPAYVEAYHSNFREFERLRAISPDGCELTKPGEKKMTIRVGSFNQGVCLAGYHAPVATREELERQVAGYLFACSFAPRMQEKLRELELKFGK